MLPVLETAPPRVGYACPERRIESLLRLSEPASRWAHNPESGVRLPEPRQGWKSEVIVAVPFRHGKSETFIWFAIWRLVLDRDTRIIVVSKTAMLAEKFVDHMARQLESNRALIKDFGRFRPLESEGNWRPGSGELDVAGKSPDIKDSSLQARGSKQQIRGIGADWVLGDDAIDPNDAKSKLERDRSYDWWIDDVESRVEPVTGHVFFLCTRVHLDDLPGRLSRLRWDDEDNPEVGERPMYEYISFPALRDPETNAPSIAADAVPLWEARPRWWLLKQRRKNVTRFNASFQQQPDNPEDMWFPREHLELCKDPERDLGQAGIERQFSVRCVHYDPGMTRYGVMMIGDIKRPAELFEEHILDLTRRKGLGPEEAWSLLKQWQHECGPINFFIPERNSYFWFETSPMARWCTQNGIRMKSIHTGINKRSTEMGWESLKTEIEFGRIRFPYGSLEAKKKTELCFEELAQMPHIEDNDHLSCMWLPKAAFEELYRIPTHRTMGVRRMAPPRRLGQVRLIARPQRTRTYDPSEERTA